MAISLKLFSVSLEMVIQDIDWEGGDKININDELLTYFSFTDSFVLIVINQSQAILTKLLVISYR